MERRLPLSRLEGLGFQAEDAYCGQAFSRNLEMLTEDEREGASKISCCRCRIVPGNLDCYAAGTGSGPLA